MSKPSRNSLSTPLIKVSPRFRVTIPLAVRNPLSLEVGDVLEAEVRANQIVLTPKAALARGIQESLDEARKGKRIGPFSTAGAATKALKRKS